MDEVVKSKKIRNSNIEILRIIAIFMIIIHHCCWNNFHTINQWYDNQWINILNIGGKLGVDIFFIISGYFMYKSKLSIKRLIKLEAQVLFYSLIGLVIFEIYKGNNTGLGFKDIIKYIFPTLYNVNWFFTAYIILMIFSKYINKIVDSLNKKENITFLILLFLIYVILPFFIKAKIDYYIFDHIMFLYVLGAFINKYEITKSENSKKYLIKAMLSLVITSILTIVLIFIGYKLNISFVKAHINVLFGEKSPFLMVIAVYFFLFFNSLPVRNNKIVNFVSASCFGIYLIHTNKFLITIFKEKVINLANYYNDKFLILYILGISILVFIVCLIIDIIRRCTFEKVFTKIIDRIENFIKLKKNVISKNKEIEKVGEK